MLVLHASGPGLIPGTTYASCAHREQLMSTGLGVSFEHHRVWLLNQKLKKNPVRFGKMIFIFWLHLMMPRNHSWLSTQGLFLAMYKDHMGFWGLNVDHPCARQARQAPYHCTISPVAKYVDYFVLCLVSWNLKLKRSS